MKTQSIYKVLIVDDHPLIAASIGDLLKEMDLLEVTGICTMGSDVVPFIETHEVDLVILDISLPDIDGFDIIHQIKKEKPSIRVIIHTMHRFARYEKYFYENGASGYVLKSGSSEEIIEAVKQVLEGRRYFSFMTNQNQEPIESHDLNQIQFTKEELSILKLIQLNFDNHTISNKLNIPHNRLLEIRKRMLYKTECSNTQELIELLSKNKII